jgi:hypothetical protein
VSVRKRSGTRLAGGITGEVISTAAAI